MKIDINDRYFPEEEIRTNEKPYQEYFECLKSIINFNRIDSFCDIGCANGPLLQAVQDNCPNVEVMGIEYFDWQKQAAHASVKDKIHLHDLRDPLPDNLVKKYNIVNCTETGEHIDPEFADVFIENLKTLCGKYLIISWANSGGSKDKEHDQHEQHLNPLMPADVHTLIESHGFKKNHTLSQTLINSSLNKNNFYFWWRNSLSVYEIQ